MCSSGQLYVWLIAVTLKSLEDKLKNHHAMRMLFWFISMVRYHSLSRQRSSVFPYIQSKPLLFQIVPSVWLNRVIGPAEGVSGCCEDTVCTSRQSAIKELSVPNLAVAPEIREARAC